MEYLGYLAIGVGVVVAAVTAGVSMIFGLGLIKMAVKNQIGLPDLLYSRFWTNKSVGIKAEDVLDEGGKVFVVLCIAAMALTILTMIGVGIAHCQAVAEPTPQEMHQWMNGVGATYVDTYEKDGAYFSLFMGGSFGGVPTEGFVFMFRNPRKASALIITLADKLDEQKSNAEINFLCDIAEELTKAKGMPGTGTDGQIEFTFPAKLGLLIVTRTRTPEGYQSQFMMLWGRPKGVPA